MAAFVRVCVCVCLCVCVSWLCLNPVGSQTSSNGRLSEFWGREPECLSCDLMEQRAGGWAAGLRPRQTRLPCGESDEVLVNGPLWLGEGWRKDGA